MKLVERRGKSTKTMRLSGWLMGLFTMGLMAVGNRAQGQSSSVPDLPQSAHRGFAGQAVISDSLPADKLTMLFLNKASEKGLAGDWEGAVNALTKAIEYAPDSIRSMPYGERASLYYARKQYTNALADIDSAIVYAPKLRYGRLFNSLSISYRLESHWKWKGRIFADIGRYDAALASVSQAERFLPTDSHSTYAGRVGSNEEERGRYLTLQGNLTAAELSYRKAMDAHETDGRKRPLYVSAGALLKVVELCLLTGQFDRARGLLTPIKMLNSQPNERTITKKDTIYELTDKKSTYGLDTLCEYLSHSLGILTGSETGKQAIAEFRAYCDQHSQQLPWRFTLTDAWLAHKHVDAAKRVAFSQLQGVAQSRLIQPE